MVSMNSQNYYYSKDKKYISPQIMTMQFAIMIFIFLHYFVCSNRQNLYYNMWDIGN